MGAWFEAQVVKVTKEATPTDQSSDQPRSSTDAGSSTDSAKPLDVIYYHVRYDE